MHRAITKSDRHVGLDKTVPSHTSARTLCIYVDGYHVALEGPREGIRYLNCGTFGHQPFADTLEGRLEHPRIPEQQVNVRHRAPS